MNKKIFSTETTKKLNDLIYVSGLKTLSLIEREILTKRYPNRVYRTFRLGLGASRSPRAMQASFNAQLDKVNDYIQVNSIRDAKIRTDHYWRDIKLHGLKSTTDTQLIRKHIAALKLKEEKRKKTNNTFILSNKAKSIVALHSHRAEAGATIRGLMKKFGIKANQFYTI